MQHENWRSVILLIVVLCFLALSITLLMKRKTSRFAVILISAAIVIVVLVGGVLVYGNRSLYIEDFKAFNIEALTYSNAVIDASLKTTDGRSGHSLETDDLENRLMVDSFELHFRDNRFGNLQFTILSYESGGPLEKNYQINYSGRIFTDPKALPRAERYPDGALSLRELKEVIAIIGRSDVVQTVSMPVPNSITLMLNGHTKGLSEGNDRSNVYLIQDEDIIPVSHATSPQAVNGYFVFSIVSENDYLQILYPPHGRRGRHPLLPRLGDGSGFRPDDHS
mgnify:CR=1 FL=1